jgi:hypothetical protein
MLSSEKVGLLPELKSNCSRVLALKMKRLLAGSPPYLSSDGVLNTTSKGATDEV